MAQTVSGTMKATGGVRWTDRGVGDVLTVAAGVLFLVLCMMLPMVGPAAAHGSGSPGATTAEHFASNRTAFLAMLILTLIVAGVATLSKLTARRVAGGRLPYIALGIDAACLALLVVYFAGLLQI